MNKKVYQKKFFSINYLSKKITTVKNVVTIYKIWLVQKILYKSIPSGWKKISEKNALK